MFRGPRCASDLAIILRFENKVRLGQLISVRSAY